MHLARWVDAGSWSIGVQDEVVVGMDLGLFLGKIDMGFVQTTSHGRHWLCAAKSKMVQTTAISLGRESKGLRIANSWRPQSKKP